MRSLPVVPTASDEPLYNIGVVTRLTDISMATLRAWERRYGFPESKRTSGGHRLYSERDIIQLTWVKARISEGMGTSQAINALQYMEKIARSSSQSIPLIPQNIHQIGESFLENYRDKLLQALLRCDLTMANDILGDALVFSSPETLVLSIMAPVLALLGDLWENKQINVATEHLGTNYLRQRMFIWMLSGPPPRQVPPIILACAPDELHEGSLLILGTLLRRRGWPIIYLGQSVPIPDLATTIHEINPSMVIIVAMMEQTANNLSTWSEWLPDVMLSGRPIIGFGGRIFTLDPTWRERVPGVYLGNSLQEGIFKIEQLLL
jgi:MerR family transcriptional regulator, light-induced transcriptional regulator